MIGSADCSPSGSTRRKRQRGEIIPAGKDAAKLAEKARTRMQAEVDERRNPRTKATVAQLMQRYLDVLEIEDTTRAGYERLVRLHIGPLLGHLGRRPDRRRDPRLVLPGAAPLPDPLRRPTGRRAPHRWRAHLRPALRAAPLPPAEHVLGPPDAQPPQRRLHPGRALALGGQQPGPAGRAPGAPES